MLQHPIIRYIALSLSLAFVSTGALAQFSSGVRPERYNARTQNILGQFSEPPCPLANAATVLVSAATCASDSTRGVGLNTITLTQNSVFAFPTGLPTGGNFQFGFRINHGATSQFIATFASGYRFPSAQMVNGQPTLSSPGTDYIWCSSNEGSPPNVVDCSASMLAMTGVSVTPGTFDPARILSGSSLTNNNLTMSITGSSSINYSGFGTVFHSSGFYVFEVTFGTCSTAPGPGACEIGAADSSELDSNYLGQTTHSFGWRSDGQVFLNASSISSSFPTWASGNVLDLAVDLTNHLICGRVNGGSWSPAAPGGACLSIPGMSSYNLSWAAKEFTNGDAATIDPSPTVSGTLPW